MAESLGNGSDMNKNTPMWRAFAVMQMRRAITVFLNNVDGTHLTLLINSFVDCTELAAKSRNAFSEACYINADAMQSGWTGIFKQECCSDGTTVLPARGI